MATAAAVLTFPTRRPAVVAGPPAPVRYIGVAAARVDLARTDLHRAQQTDLHAATAADLVQLIEALRSSLHDVLQMALAARAEWAVLDRAEDADLAILHPAALIELVSDLSTDLDRRIA